MFILKQGIPPFIQPKEGVIPAHIHPINLTVPFHTEIIFQCERID